MSHTLKAIYNEITCTARQDFSSKEPEMKLLPEMDLSSLHAETRSNPGTLVLSQISCRQNNAVFLKPKFKALANTRLKYEREKILCIYPTFMFKFLNQNTCCRYDYFDIPKRLHFCSHLKQLSRQPLEIYAVKREFSDKSSNTHLPEAVISKPLDWKSVGLRLIAESGLSGLNFRNIEGVVIDRSRVFKSASMKRLQLPFVLQMPEDPTFPETSKKHPSCIISVGALKYVGLVEGLIERNWIVEEKAGWCPDSVALQLKSENRLIRIFKANEIDQFNNSQTDYIIIETA